MLSGVKRFLDRHPDLKAFLTKLGKDNIGMLAAFVSWSILTSLVPIVVGLVAISGFLLRSNPSAQSSVVTHLSSGLQGAISAGEIRKIVAGSTRHAGLLGVIGLVGIFWGGSNVGGALSTSFQPVFEVGGRNFIKEKLIDIGMIFVFTFLMLIILAATAASSLINRLTSSVPVPAGTGQWVIGTAISVISAFLLFLAIYLVFPNVKPRFKLPEVWRGAVLAAVLFQILTFIWPVYASFSHFNRFGAVFFPLLVLGAWIYFFSMITMIGAEVVGVAATKKGRLSGRRAGL